MKLRSDDKTVKSRSSLFILGQAKPIAPSLVGQKAAALDRLIRLDLPVPPALVIPVGACAQILATNSIPPALQKALDQQLRKILPKSKATIAVRVSPVTQLPGLARTALNISPQPATLHAAILAAIASWKSPLAAAQRRKMQLPDDCGLAVVLQAMVHATASHSASGKAFTRDPATGQPTLTGEFALATHGPDLLSAQRLPIAQLQQHLPIAWKRFTRLCTKLEQACHDVQDFQFVIENNRPWLLMSRDADRSAIASVKLAVAFAKEKLATRAQAVLRVEPHALEKLLHPVFDSAALPDPIATGNAASAGCASGLIAFSAAQALQRASAGQSIILVRVETDAADLIGMQAVRGILTSTGGMTSHAAVEARALGTPCVSGASSLHIDSKKQRLIIGSQTFGPGDWISLDGARGEIYPGHIPTVAPELSDDLQMLLSWADEIKTLDVRANADTPRDAALARQLGARGIGLCRTEHMFFDPDRLHTVRQMILAPTRAARQAALDLLLPWQTQDFVGLFTAMAGLPVTIRLLDPPLHEFLPHEPADQKALAKSLKLKLSQLQQRVRQLKEANPMLGHRGCRLCITYPEILTMQATAIFQAVLQCRDDGLTVLPEIMIPLVGTPGELLYCRNLIEAAAAKVVRDNGQQPIHFRLGTMIEVPRAALLADHLAQSAEFFSFGTNDLTQLTFGYSRDDAGAFLPDMLAKRILPHDPFISLDHAGVGKLIEIAIEKGRKTRPDLKLGLCGEHGADAPSVALCHNLGLDYVSCSPYRVPLARLAAAQAALRQ